jgi:CD109 antigen
MPIRLSRRTFLTASGASVAAAALAALTELGPRQRRTPASPTATEFPRASVTPGVDETVQGYLAIAPSTLRAGQTENIALTLMRGTRPASSTVTVTLLRDDRVVAQTALWTAGHGVVPLAVPAQAGAYTLRVSGKGFHDETDIQVEDSALVFVETDKPIYKPGQTAHIRVLALDPHLKPQAGEALVEVLDATGIKIFRQTLTLDDFGMASLDLPLSTEPNLGVWKAIATVGERSNQLDLRVERYVLPKFEVTLELAQAWVLVGDALRGTVSAEYSFGKPVNGEVEIVATRYVGVWEEYARVTLPLPPNGAATFELPAVEYVAGAPEGGGLGSVRLDATVREQATGYSGQTSQLVTVADSPVALRLVPDTSVFKPGLPFGLLVVAETPDHQPVDANVRLQLTWPNDDYSAPAVESRTVTVSGGLGTLVVTPPASAVSLYIEASAPNASVATLELTAGFSPSGSFIHVAQASVGQLKVGDSARFNVYTTRETPHVYYEVLARGMVVFSDVSELSASAGELALPLTPLMAPSARLLVYQILPDGEVAADYLPFSVSGDYPQTVSVSLGQASARPGDELDVQVQTQGTARVGLAAVDRSVFILAENRLNLQQVFAELERLALLPQAELHDGGLGPVDEPWNVPSAPTGSGASELFQAAGVLLLTNREVPEAPSRGNDLFFAEAAAQPLATTAAGAAAPAADDAATHAANPNALAEPARVRQFFPETWLWNDLTTDADGRATQRVTAPDSITTWMFRAVALSREHGLGIGEAQLQVIQPFFVQVDLPYAATRGEELPASVALYNYLATDEEFTVELEGGDWFDALDAPSRTVRVAANEVGALAFSIRPTALGVGQLRVTARGRDAADALVKELIVEPEGVACEAVENLTLTPDTARDFALSAPPEAIDGSARAVLALTGNVLSQAIDGLDALLQMPFGCGEQNMLLFAPDVFVARYLKETGQLKPEVMAKAETLMLTGYQRELTYRRSDGSFSAFGESDPQGSLWLTAFVLKTFAQAQGLIYIDDTVLGAARQWIGSHQRGDGAFEPFGFIHHEDLLGGLSGTTALTAVVAIALLEAGDDGAANAVRYLESQLAATSDAYALAVSAYALALAGSVQAGAAHDALLGLARESADGLWWGNAPDPLATDSSAKRLDDVRASATVETTAYATLALLTQHDELNAGRAMRWLVTQRNSAGGFGSTQDTVVALQAMTSAAASSRSEIDATLTLSMADWSKQVHIGPDNADVMQFVELPAGASLNVDTRGTGQVTAQLVRR